MKHLLRSLLCWVFLLYLSSQALAQTVVITGRVVRASNKEPLVGASISVKGTKRGTVTDTHGRYRLNVPQQGPISLIAHFVGFTDTEHELFPESRRVANFELISSDQQLADLKVAANRVEEYLQNVPVAASVISSVDLEKRSVYNTMEALNNAPNLITDSWLSSQVSFSMRGLSTVFDNVGFESTVALYIDDVYFSRSFGFNSTLMDIERVDILRGPQGTLFGKNTIGGVIHIVSEKPEMANNGQIELNYGNYNFFQVRAKINRQLIKNKLALRITGARTRRDGYIVDKVPAIEAVNKTDFYGLRSSLLYTPNDNTTITLRGYYGKDNNAENTFVYASKPDSDPLGIKADEGLNTNQSIPNTFNRKQYGGVLKGEFKLGRNTLTSISAYYNSRDQYFGDNDVAAADVSLWGRTQKLRNVSQELRIHSPRDQSFAFVGGLYYLNEEIGATDVFSLGKDFVPVAEEILGTKLGNINYKSEGYSTVSTIRSQSFAGFFSGSLALRPKLRLTAGLRLTSEKRTLSYYQTVDYQYTNGQPIGLIDIYATPVGSPSAPLQREADNVAPSFDLGVDYKFSPFTLGYAKFVRGFKGAGFNTSVTTDPEGGGLVFKPEYVDSYELGLKTKPSDRIRFNTAAFYVSYRNKQELLDQGTRVRVANAPLTRGWGIESEFSAMLKRFRIDVSAGYLDLKYVDFPFGEDDNGNPVNYAGNRLLKAPDFTFSIAPDYSMPLTDRLQLTLGLNINHTGKAYNDISNSEIIARQPATIFNGRMAITPRTGKWSVALWGKNLSNTRFIQHGWEYDWGDQISWSRPRYYGLELYLNFL